MARTLNLCMVLQITVSDRIVSDITNRPPGPL